MKKKILIVFLILIRIAFAQAQEEELDEIYADRPDQTETPRTVEQNFLQLETGFFYEKFREDEENKKRFGYNEMLLRYGLFKKVELRLGTRLIKERIEKEDDLIKKGPGLEPLKVGAKIGLVEEKGLLPEIGFMGHLHLPFAASPNFRTADTGIDFRFSFLHSLSENSDLSYNLGVQWLEDSAEAEYLYTVSYDADITGNFGYFIEVFGDLPQNNKAEHHWDAGITYLLNNNLQFDLLVGTGINAPQKLIAGAGVSYRIPK